MTDPEDHEPKAALSGAGYVAVWAGLVGLATLSLLVSRAVTGGLGLGLSLAIAAIKAGLVAAFFMHLRGGRPIHRIVFAVAVGFIVLLVLGILADVGTRPLASSYVDDVGRPR